MSPILKLDKPDEEKKILFELKFLSSLTTRLRFEMMLKKSEEMKKLLAKHENRKSPEIIKRK